MSTQLSIVQGDAADYPLQAQLRGGEGAPIYAAGDALVSTVYQGQEIEPSFSPAVGWYTANGTQTGYGQGQVLVSISNAQGAMLEALGTYTLLVTWTPAADPTKSATIVRTTLYVEPAPGTATESILTYCQLSDMMMYAGWIAIVQNRDVDGEGFYSQRLQARQWMDRQIINNYRGAFVGMFEDLSVMAFDFGNVGWRRSQGPSTALIGYLAANDLILREDIIRVCAYKAISIIGLAQIGVNNQFVGFGAYFRDMATRELAAITAEIDLNADGVGELFVILGGTNTLRS